MPIDGQGATGTSSVGFPYLAVLVESCDARMAICTDSFGKTRQISLTVRRGGGPLPREGEYWLIDRSLGQWYFAAVIRSKPPVVSGTLADGSALVNLLTTLQNMGLIVSTVGSGDHYSDIYTDTY